MIEVAEARELEVEPDRAQRGGIGDVVVADVVDLERAAVELRNSMSVVSLPKKLPSPATRKSVPTWPKKFAAKNALPPMS